MLLLIKSSPKWCLVCTHVHLIKCYNGDPLHTTITLSMAGCPFPDEASVDHLKVMHTCVWHVHYVLTACYSLTTLRTAVEQQPASACKSCLTELQSRQSVGSQFRCAAWCGTASAVAHSACVVHCCREVLVQQHSPLHLNRIPPPSLPHAFQLISCQYMCTV